MDEIKLLNYLGKTVQIELNNDTIKEGVLGYSYLHDAFIITNEHGRILLFFKAKFVTNMTIIKEE